MGRVGFEISDIPGRGEGVVYESSDVRKFLKIFSQLFFKYFTEQHNRIGSFILKLFLN